MKLSLSGIKEGFKELDTEFDQVIGPVLENARVQQMKRFNQHGDTTCYDHSLRVSRMSYRLCRFFGLDADSAARGAMLHDFFLYSWRAEQMSGREHLSAHPAVALKTAEEEFELNDTERDIIANHMWPVTRALPESAEGFAVSMVDKLSAVMEAAEYAVRRTKTTGYRYAGYATLCLSLSFRMGGQLF